MNGLELPAALRRGPRRSRPPIRWPGRRATSTQHFPQRVSYLIDPEGVVRKGYVVADVRGHAGHVLDDLVHLQAAAR